MALKLTAPVEQEFTLERTDKHFGTTGTTVRIRQATQAQHERRARMFSKMTQRVEETDYGTQAISYVQDFNFPELMRLEAKLTVIGSNIDDEGGKPLFREGMSDSDFDKAWGKLPTLVAHEIHSKVLEVNPDWVPRGE